MELNFGELSNADKIHRLEASGLFIDNPASWTDLNCERFKEKNSNVEIMFGEEVTLRYAPYNVECLIGTFSESNAKRLVATNWDLSDARAVLNLFKDNRVIEDIDITFRTSGVIRKYILERRNSNEA